MTAIGDYIRTRLKELRYSQRQLGSMAEVSNTEVKRIIDGSRKKPSQDTLAKLAGPLKVDRNKLFSLAGYYVGESAEEAAERLRTNGIEAHLAGPVVFLPVYEEAAAGSPVLAREKPEAWESIGVDVVQGDMGNFYFVRIKGESMAPLISDGALVLVHRQPSVDNGQIALVRFTDNNEVTIKRVRYLDRRILLMPANPSYHEEEVSLDNIEVVGRVVRAIKTFE